MTLQSIIVPGLLGFLCWLVTLIGAIWETRRMTPGRRVMMIFASVWTFLLIVLPIYLAVFVGIFGNLGIFGSVLAVIVAGVYIAGFIRLERKLDAKYRQQHEMSQGVISNPKPGFRFNPPPNWPPAPHGWSPPPGWRHDASWPEPPAGWQLWVPDSNSAPEAPRPATSLTADTKSMPAPVQLESRAAYSRQALVGEETTRTPVERDTGDDPHRGAPRQQQWVPPRRSPPHTHNAFAAVDAPIASGGAPHTDGVRPWLASPGILITSIIVAIAGLLLATGPIWGDILFGYMENPLGGNVYENTQQRRMLFEIIGMVLLLAGCIGLALSLRARTSSRRSAGTPHTI
jgi:hypothetical protein